VRCGAASRWERRRWAAESRFPARIGGIDRPLTLFIRPQYAIDFNAPDGKPVDNILVILVPSGGDTDDHLQLLALIAQLFSDGAFRKRLAGAGYVVSVQGAFVEWTKRVVRP
jgi:PTS system nitrogen regulatory IIA component